MASMKNIERQADINTDVYLCEEELFNCIECAL